MVYFISLYKSDEPLQQYKVVFVMANNLCLLLADWIFASQYFKVSRTSQRTFTIAKLEWLEDEAQEDRVTIIAQKGWNTMKLLAELAAFMEEPEEKLTLIEIFARVDKVKSLQQTENKQIKARMQVVSMIGVSIFVVVYTSIALLRLLEFHFKLAIL